MLNHLSISHTRPCIIVSTPILGSHQSSNYSGLLVLNVCHSPRNSDHQFVFESSSLISLSSLPYSSSFFQPQSASPSYHPQTTPKTPPPSPASSNSIPSSVPPPPTPVPVPPPSPAAAPTASANPSQTDETHRHS